MTHENTGVSALINTTDLSDDLKSKLVVSDFGKVAVLLGGDSAERAVSLKSGHAVLNALLGAGVDAHPFDPSQQTLLDLKTQGFSRAIIMLHGRGGEDGVIQGALQQLGVPFTGSGVLGSAIAMDKVHSKQIWSAVGLPTANYAVAKSEHADEAFCEQTIQRLGAVLMVKPAREGSSIGMAKTHNVAELQHAIANALKYDELVLIEQYITGQEFTVAILNGKALPSIRMQTPHVFYDYDAKYTDTTTEYFCPSGLSASHELALQKLSVKAFNALSGEGWGRVDVMQDHRGEFLLLESNTAPGMTETSLVPKAAEQAGLSFVDLALAILATSMKTT